MFREGYQGNTCLHICSLSPGASRRTPGEDLSCPSWCSLSLGTSRGVPGEGLYICSLSPGAPIRTPGEDFVRLGVVCPLVYTL